MARILIVDEPEIADALEYDLKLEGYEVEVVRDGHRALERGREPGWDLILLDVMLPKMDGFDVCRGLRKAGVTASILFLTAKTHEAEKVLGLDLGADDYVTKPFSGRELRARIRARLRTRPAESPEVLECAGIVIDTARAEVTRDGVRAEMTAQEFRLLVVFARNRGRLLSREQLIDLAWGHDTFLTDRAVDAHIVNLRRKLGMESISSVRGMGYRFDG